MGRKITSLLFLLISVTAFSQFRSSEQYSIEGDFGLSGAMNPSMSGLNHLGVGFRYMADDLWGFKGDLASDRFRESGTEAGTNYTRFSVQAVYNAGRALYVPDITNGYVNFLVHGGVGYSYLKSTRKSGIDNIGNVIIGVTPQFYISSRLAVHLDASYIFNIKQHYDFDGFYHDGGLEESGFVGQMFTASIGLTLYLGRNGSDNDWR
jgi:OOP family OmpA-OmpF porin